MYTNKYLIVNIFVPVLFTVLCHGLFCEAERPWPLAAIQGEEEKGMLKI
jgi:hypothetical protein